MKIFASIVGLNGKMGKELIQNAQKYDFEIVGGIGRNDILALDDLMKKSRVVFDFSSPLAIDDVLYFAKKNRCPLVIGTTGYNEKEIEKITLASKEIPICLSSNYSLGVALIKSFLNQASKIFYDSFVDIIEKHHILKKDKPSGTALSIANEIQNNLQKKISIHSIRAANIVGEHSIFFTNDSETIEIKHIANTRAVFARGALSVARVIINKKNGLYSISDLLGDFYASNQN